MDMRGLAKLLYRDDVRQKHSAKNAVREQLKNNAIVTGRGRAVDPGPVTASAATQMIGNHLLEAASFLYIMYGARSR